MTKFLVIGNFRFVGAQVGKYVMSQACISLFIGKVNRFLCETESTRRLNRLVTLFSFTSVSYFFFCRLTRQKSLYVYLSFFSSYMIVYVCLRPPVASAKYPAHRAPACVKKVLSKNGTMTAWINYGKFNDFRLYTTAATSVGNFVCILRSV